MRRVFVSDHVPPTNPASILDLLALIRAAVIEVEYEIRWGRSLEREARSARDLSALVEELHQRRDYRKLLIE
jgi:hypothetical protein